MDKTEMKTLIETLLQKLMGEALDCGRMAIDNERQYKQFERSVRSRSRALISDGQKIIDDSGDTGTAAQ